MSLTGVGGMLRRGLTTNEDRACHALYYEDARLALLVLRLAPLVFEE